MKMSNGHPLREPISRQGILNYLGESPGLGRQFEGLNEKLQEEFLNFCSGASGLRICYDPVFKFILDPEHHPQRLSEFLSVILKKKIRIKKVLSRESERLLEKGSLVIMDLVVELEDGSLATVEIQKIAHAFPGSRGACYSSDLVLRQYSKARDREKKDFSYRDLKTVYTIVILENSSGEFHKFPNNYIHHAKQQFDTNLEMDLLQEYVFMALDVYKEIIHNKGIKTPLEAWLGFLSFDNPERIWEIQSKFPQFKEMYQDMADFRADIEEVLSMFSKELAIMDRNNVKYMMDEDKAEIRELNKTLREKKRILEEQECTMEEQERTIKEQICVMEEQAALIEKLKAQLEK